MTVIEGLKQIRGIVNIGGSTTESSASISLALLTSGSCVIKNVPQSLELAKLIAFVNSNLVIAKRESNLELIINTQKKFVSKDVTLTLGPEKEFLFLIPYFARERLNFKLKLEKNLIDECNVFLWLLDKFGLIKKESAISYLSDFKTSLVNQEMSIDVKTFSLEEILFCILVSIVSKSMVKIINAPRHPKLKSFLNLLKISGADILEDYSLEQDTLIVKPVDSLTAFSFSVSWSIKEAGFYSFLISSVSGALVFKGVKPSEFLPLTAKLSNWGVEVESVDENTVKVWCGREKTVDTIGEIESKPYPGLLMSWAMFTLVYLSSNGIQGSIIFPEQNLLNSFVVELNRMGATTKMESLGSGLVKVSVSSRSAISGKKIIFQDSRTVLGQFLAVLSAKGKSQVVNFNVLEKSFPNVFLNLTELGVLKNPS